VTITYGNQNASVCLTRSRVYFADCRHSNIAQQLIEKGLATVLRHKRDDEDRSAELDKLIIAEQSSVQYCLALKSVDMAKSGHGGPRIALNKGCFAATNCRCV